MVRAKYGIIVCPKCGMAKGVESSKKTTTCQCGRQIQLSRMKLMFLTDSPLELADSVAAANASLRGGERMPREKKPRKHGPYAAIVERAKALRDPLERMQVIAEGLTELKSEFEIDDLKRVASMLGKDSAEDMLAKLKGNNLVYEIGAGRYRSV